MRDLDIHEVPDHQLSAYQLQDKYADTDWGHHPKFTRNEWISLVAEEETILGYWEWVHRMVIDDEDQQDE